MSRRLISSASAFEAEIGHARAVVDGDFVFVSGTTGYDYATMTIADDVAAKCHPILREAFGATRPAATLIHAGLATDAMRIAIEVTARLPRS